MKLAQLATAVILASGSYAAHAATYSVTPLPTNDIAANNFAMAIDNTGTMVTVTGSEYNPPIDLTMLDLENEALRAQLTDPEAVEQGNFNTADYTFLYRYLFVTNANSLLFQKLAENRSYQGDTASFELIPGLDEVTDTFNDYTQSAFAVTRDVESGQFFVGTSQNPWQRVDYINSEDVEIPYVYNETYRRAFAQINGVSVSLAPVDATLGGYSEAFAINQNLQVAGYGTTEFLDTVQERIDNCDDEEQRGDVPIEVCLQTIRNSAVNFLLRNQFRAHIWQLDQAGTVQDVTTYDILFTPEEDNTTRYASRAFAINDNGLAVGDAHTGEEVPITRPESNTFNELGQVATMFKDGETTELLPRGDSLLSSALAVNNNNWVAGTVTRERSGIARDRLFVHNIDSGETVYPDGLFVGAGAVPRAINESNIVVGKVDAEATSDRVRTTHAFMYHIDTDEFIDLNNLIACDAPYTLVDAVDINDNNEIVANALVRENQRYIDGSLVVDANGENKVIDKIVAVKLNPLANGQVEDCESEEEQKYERQGASFPLWATLLLGVFAFRRRFK